MTEYVVIYEQGEDGWGAYSPDLPGVVSHGDTHDEAVAGMREAVGLYLDELRRVGAPAPRPRSVMGTITA